MKKNRKKNPILIRGTEEWEKAYCEIGDKGCVPISFLLTLTEAEIECLHHVEKRLNSSDYMKYYTLI